MHNHSFVNYETYKCAINCALKSIGLHYTGMFPVGDTSSGTLIAVCVCVSLSADISLYCAKNDSTDYPEIVWVCWV